MKNRIIGVTALGLGIAFTVVTPAWAGTDTGTFITTDGDGLFKVAGGEASFKHTDDRFEVCDKQNDGRITLGIVYPGSHPNGSAKIDKSGFVIGGYYTARVSREDPGLSTCSVKRESNSTMNLSEGKSYTFEVCLMNKQRTKADYCRRRVATA